MNDRDRRRRVPMAWGDREGRVPRKLRDELRGLFATGDNDVARGSLEDDDPLSYVGDEIIPRRLGFDGGTR